MRTRNTSKSGFNWEIRICKIIRYPFLRQKDEEEDVVDSDFSIDEQDELVSDQEEPTDRKRKRGGVNTKAYKVQLTLKTLLYQGAMKVLQSSI